MTIESFKSAREILQTADDVSFDDSFELAGFCAKHLNDGRSEEARDIVIRALDQRHRLHPGTLSIWNDVVEVAGLHPYLDGAELSGASLLRWEFHRSSNIKGVTYHEEQLPISLALLRGQSVVVSAPTSFGKSLLIEELVASGKYSNIVVVQPTIALLDETRKKLRKYESRYKIVVSTSQEPSTSMNVFLFTAERVVEYQRFPRIDFFVIDEFYKLSINRDDQRAIVLNHAFHKLTKYTYKFYMLGPMIRSLPEQFHNRFQFQWVHTYFRTVAVNEVDMEGPPTRQKDEQVRPLYALLDKLEDQTLVYCSSPQRASRLCIDYATWLGGQGGVRNGELSNGVQDTIEWIAANIHSEWGLVPCLKQAVAFHHGAVPRHLGSSLVDLFNAGKIRVLFCTSTLIEGVNTTARNVVLFDKRKGPKNIDYFDYRNIAGRSGRMKCYYVGNVFRFHPEPQQLELDIDVPAITQTDAPIELLVQLDSDEIQASRVSDLKQFNALDEELRAIIRANSGINVEGQIALVRELQDRATDHHALLSWRRLPTYGQLKHCNRLIWDYLLTSRDSRAGIGSPEQLAVLTLQYHQTGSISGLISLQIESEYWRKRIPDYAERVNKIIFQALSVLRTWFDFRLPKVLMALSRCQDYVFTRASVQPGDYSYFAGLIQNSFLPAALSAVMEYDVPASALRKIMSSIPWHGSVDDIIKTIRGLALERFEMAGYELQKLREV